MLILRIILCCFQTWLVVDGAEDARDASSLLKSPQQGNWQLLEFSTSAKVGNPDWPVAVSMPKKEKHYSESHGICLLSMRFFWRHRLTCLC